MHIKHVISFILTIIFESDTIKSKSLPRNSAASITQKCVYKLIRFKVLLRWVCSLLCTRNSTRLFSIWHSFTYKYFVLIEIHCVLFLCAFAHHHYIYWSKIYTRFELGLRCVCTYHHQSAVRQDNLGLIKFLSDTHKHTTEIRIPNWKYYFCFCLLPCACAGTRTLMKPRPIFVHLL